MSFPVWCVTSVPARLTSPPPLNPASLSCLSSLHPSGGSSVFPSRCSESVNKCRRKRRFPVRSPPLPSSFAHFSSLHSSYFHPSVPLSYSSLTPVCIRLLSSLPFLILFNNPPWLFPLWIVGGEAVAAVV